MALQPLNQNFTLQEKRLVEDEGLDARYSPTVTRVLYFRPTDQNLGLDVVAHARDFNGRKIDYSFDSYYYIRFCQLLEPIDARLIRKFYG